MSSEKSKKHFFNAEVALEVSKNQAIQVLFKGLPIILSVIHAKGRMAERHFIPISLIISIIATLYFISLGLDKIDITKSNFEINNNARNKCRKKYTQLDSKDNDIEKKIIAVLEKNEKNKRETKLRDFINIVTVISLVGSKIRELLFVKKSKVTKQEEASEIIEYIKSETDDSPPEYSTPFICLIVISEIVSIAMNVMIPLSFKKDLINAWQYAVFISVNFIIGIFLPVIFTCDRIANSKISQISRKVNIVSGILDEVMIEENIQLKDMVSR